MTYLLPDDWYANHGLAPGDARLPQPNMQPVPGGLAPTPPMRGYYGPRPPQPALYAGPARTVSPMAVSDQMWGVNGLGALPVAMPCPCGARQVGMTRDGWCVCARGHHFTTVEGPPRAGLGAGTAPSPRYSRAALGLDPLVAAPPTPGVLPTQAQQTTAITTAVSQAQAQTAAVVTSAASVSDQTSAILAKAAEDMKRQAMIAAGVNTSIAMGLQFIPIVGQITAIVYGVITAIIGTVYEKKAKKVLADVQNRVNALAATLTTQYSQAQADTIKQETPVAIQLLLSGAPLAGLGACDGMGNILDSAWNSISTQVNRAVTAVDVNARRATNALIAAGQTIDGDSILKKAQQAADAAYASASAQMYAQFNAEMAKLKDPAFLHALDVYLAKQFQADPNYVALADKNAILQAGADGTITGVTVATPKTDMLIPGLTAAGITLAVLTL